MSAAILPFPLARRRDLVRKQAGLFARSAPRAAENLLGLALDTQRKALLRKGCDPAAAEAQVQALEGAIRAEVWRIVLTPVGAA